LLVNEVGKGLIARNITTGEAISFFDRLPPAQRPIYHRFGHSLSPDGSRLAMKSDSGLGLDIWDLPSNRLLYSLPDENGAVYWLAWSADARQLAVACSNGDIAIWRLDEMARYLAQLDSQP
jgi:WD40 repeat protein